MKTSSIAVITSLLSLALAQPHNHHARHHHDKREIVWETVWEETTETVGITTTITVTPGAATTEASTTLVAPPSASNSPGIFIEPASVASTTSSVVIASAPIQAVESSSTPVYVAPTTTTPVYVAPTTATAPVYVAPTTSTTFSSVYVPPTTSSTPVYVAPTTTSIAAAPTTASSSSSGITSECSESAPCTGDLTYYTTGEGACGWTNDGTVENVVALSYLLMGSESNNGEGGMNPYCGKMITVSYGGSTTTAKVVDKCMGCDTLSIDLSPLAFSKVSPMAAGRVVGEWYFSD